MRRPRPPAACPFAEGTDRNLCWQPGARRVLWSGNETSLEDCLKCSLARKSSRARSPQKSERPPSPGRRRRAQEGAHSRWATRPAPLCGDKGPCRGWGAARGPRYLHPLGLGAALGRPHLQAGGDALLQQGPGPRRLRCRHGGPAALRAGPGHAFPAPAPAPAGARGARAGEREAGPCADG